MDNITHTLIGFAAGEAAAQVRANRPGGIDSRIRPYYWLASAVGNNIPDLDVFLSPFLSHGKVGSLLLHRGYTHTLLLAIPQALLFILGLWLYARAKRVAVRASEWAILFALTIFGVGTHIFADAWNSYGVHPFWPWNPRWYFGDFIFIVEPWIWLALLPPLYYAAYSRILRGTFVSLFLLMLGLIWGTTYVIMPMKIILSIGAGIFVLTKNLAPLRRVNFALGSVVFILTAFFAVHAYAEYLVKRSYETRSIATLHDIILSPYPANPLCWQAIAVETSGVPPIYSLHIGVVSPLPNAVSTQQCGNLRFQKSTAPLKTPQLSNDAHLRWLGAFQAPIAELTQLRKQSCNVAALLRFTRAPFWQVEGKTFIFGDLRYDREETIGFAEIQGVLGEEKCPQHIPSWQEPRADLLGL